MTEQPVAPAPAAAAPIPPAPTAPAPISATDLAAEIARLQAELDRTRGHSRTWEERAKANENAAPKLTAMEQQLAAIAKHVGLPNTAPDPEAVVRQLQVVQEEKAQLARERAVLLAASTVGANAAALLDSRAFAQQLAGIDPADSAAVQTAMKAAIETNPLYAATPVAPVQSAPPAPRQASTASSFNGSPGQPQQLGEADMKNMSGSELSAAMKAGRFDAYFATPNQ